MKGILLMWAGLFTVVGMGTFSSNSTQVFSVAKQFKKPILIYFYGIWCPPCNELKETVFEDPQFINLSAKFELLQVDADSPKSWVLKDRYKVGGYPTIVFTDFEGKEIYRVVGYRTPPEFIRILELAVKARSGNWEEACRSENVDDLWRCALICSERKENACATAAYKKLEGKLPTGSPRYLMARGYSVESSATPDLKRDGYERLLQEFPKSPIALLWSVQYLSLFEDIVDPKPKKNLVEAVLNHYPAVLKDPSRDELGIPVTDMAQMRAEILQKLGKVERAKVAWNEACQILADHLAGLPKNSPRRGFTIERIFCLESAGRFDEALKLALEYRQKFPEEFTFHYIAASLLDRAKRANEALPAAKRAYEHSYGDNKIRAATLLVRLYKTAGNKELAEKIYLAVKKEIQPDATLNVRTHRYLKQLDASYQK